MDRNLEIELRDNWDRPDGIQAEVEPTGENHLARDSPKNNCPKCQTSVRSHTSVIGVANIFVKKVTW